MVEREGMRRGGCGWGGGVLGRWSLRRLLLDSPLVGRRLAHSGKLLYIYNVRKYDSYYKSGFHIYNYDF